MNGLANTSPMRDHEDKTDRSLSLYSQLTLKLSIGIKTDQNRTVPYWDQSDKHSKLSTLQQKVRCGGYQMQSILN